MKLVEVAAAIIKFDNKFLCLQRGQSQYDYVSFKYEFPGGKLEEDESEKDCLIREIKEELDIDIIVNSFFMRNEIVYHYYYLSMLVTLNNSRNST